MARQDGIAIWEPPGPGTWELDASHAPPAPTRTIRRIHQSVVGPAYRWAFETYGGPIDAIEVRWVNGKMYRRVVPLVGADSDRPPPPAPILWLASRLHPLFRKRNRLALQTLATDNWLAVLDEWAEGERQQWIDDNLAFEAVDLAGLVDGALAEHVLAVDAHCVAGYFRHHQLHASDLGPIGDLLAHAARWGLDPPMVMTALRGLSPATAEVPTMMADIATALRDAGVDPAGIDSLDDVRQGGQAAAAALDRYLSVYGSRIVTSYDIEGRMVSELPEAIVAMIRQAATAAAHEVDPEPDRVAAALRASLAGEHRDRFDDLLDKARRAYGLRDDNGPLTAEWPMGLVRRAYLEAGRRLAASGRLREPDHVFELDSPEVAAALRGTPEPDHAEIERRVEERRWEATLVGPRFLGPIVDPPDPAPLPEGLRRVTELVTAAVSMLEPEDPVNRRPLEGLGIGDEPHVGRARVAHRPEDVLTTMLPGDVLVAVATAPTYNAVLSLAGGVVVQEGGLLCHAAVLARELRIPAVIGAADVMTEIRDGDLVEVDPVAGTVRVLERAG